MAKIVRALASPRITVKAGNTHYLTNDFRITFCIQRYKWHKVKYDLTVKCRVFFPTDLGLNKKVHR